jgi:hypothetical protein
VVAIRAIVFVDVFDVIRRQTSYRSTMEMGVSDRLRYWSQSRL